MTKQHTFLSQGGGKPKVTTARALLAGFAAMLVMTPALAPPAEAELRAVGPTAANGFPSWYEDTRGVQLAQCLDAEACALEPAPLPGELPAEVPYFSAEAGVPTGNGQTANLVLALEGAEDGGKITSGGIIINAGGLTPGETYKVTHPYGVETVTADARGQFRFLGEAGCDIEPGEECDFGAALGTRIGPFLAWNPAAGPAAPDGSLGDPEVPHEVVGSPNGTNLFKVEGPNAGGPGVNKSETELFSVVGQVEGLAAFASVGGGTFEAAQNVVLDASESEANVFYTLDGSDPLTSPTRLAYAAGQQINVGQTSTLSYVAVDANGGGRSAVFIERYVIAPPTSLSLSASPSALPYGQTATLSGQLTSSGAALAGKPMVLEQKAAGAADFDPSGQTQTTDANGNYSFAVSPNVNTAYRVSFAGEQEGYKPSVSGNQQITMQAVASTTSLTLSRTTMDRSLAQTSASQRLAISGKVSPAHAGKTVMVSVQRFNSTTRKWVNAQAPVSRVLSASSAYSYAYKPSASAPLGSYRATVSFAGDLDHKPSAATKGFRLVR